MRRKILSFLLPLGPEMSHRKEASLSKQFPVLFLLSEGSAHPGQPPDSAPDRRSPCCAPASQAVAAGHESGPLSVAKSQEEACQPRVEGQRLPPGFEASALQASNELSIHLVSWSRKCPTGQVLLSAPLSIPPKWRGQPENWMCF
ncbi:uncharacterized protein [Bos taurus]|uniref:uncharacterized protein n=1 Tax=Bos taurus TaxID=9913 RepID=UPI0028CB7A3D|nr:uncharacterized protein LOC112445007 [Bos taurus]